MDKNIKNYLQYVSGVLGINKIMQPESAVEVEIKVEEVFRTKTGHWPERKDFDLVVLNCDPDGSLFHGESGEQYQKMFSAMQLGPFLVLEIQSQGFPDENHFRELFKFIQTKSLLLLSPEAQALPGKFFAGFCVSTYSPGALLITESRKREAWEAMKEIMRYLGVPVKK